MSGSPAFVVLPVSADGTQHPNQRPDQDTAEIASAIQQSLHEKAHPEEYKEPERTGPLKQILDNQDSLYRYISWEDPARTLGCYVGSLGILFGAHYLPLTQLALKAGVTTLGVVSVTEYTSRQFGPNSFSTLLRPKEYKKVPEQTLNATLKDIHDLVQYGVVQAQRILFGQDLNKTFAAFIGFAVFYWLIKIVPPFGLAVIALTSLYIAPLVVSPQGRAIAQEASTRAQEFANATAENSKELAQDGRAKAAELSSKARQTVLDAEGRVQNMAQSGQQTAADLSARARDTASRISGVGAENVRNPPQIGATGVANKVSQISNSTLETPRQLRSGDNTPRQPASDHLESAVSSLPGHQATGDKTYSATDTVSKYAAAGDTASTHGIEDRPRDFA